MYTTQEKSEVVERKFGTMPSNRFNAKHFTDKQKKTSNNEQEKDWSKKQMSLLVIFL